MDMRRQLRTFELPTVYICQGLQVPGHPETQDASTPGRPTHDPGIRVLHPHRTILNFRREFSMTAQV